MKLLYKTVIKIISLLFLGIFLFTSCDKDSERLSSFEFELIETHSDTSIINVGESTLITIIPEVEVSSNSYEIRYNITNGSGVFQFQDNTTIIENEWTEIETLELDLSYISNEIGENNISFSVRDGVREETIELTYNVEHNPFTVDLNTISPTATVNEMKNFTLILDNTGEDQTVTYTASLFLSQGSGTISLLDDDGIEILTVNQNESFEIIPGTYNYEIILEEEGMNILNVNIEDSNGQTMTDTIEFAVNVINFDFTASPEQNDTNLGVDVGVNFSIIETDGGNDTYSMRYVLDNGNAQFFSESSQIFAGTNIDVPLGDFSWLFRPSEIGSVTITFFARNNSGVEKEETIVIDVLDRDFDFNVTPNVSSTSLGETVNLTYQITESGGSSQDSYTFTWSSDKNGSLTINGTTIIPGQPVSVNTLNFNALYSGEESGLHTITSTLTANSNGFEVQKEASFEYQQSDFTFNITSDNELTVGEQIPLSFNINEISGNSDISLSYSIAGPEQEIRNDNNIALTQNTDFDLENNTFIYSLMGLEAGDSVITFTLTNQFGIVRSQTISYTILPIDFSFTVSPIGTLFDLNTPISFSFDMDAPNTLTYEASFNSNTNGTMFFLGSEVSENNFTSVSSTDFNSLYIPTLGGSSVINFTIRASNGVEKTQTINIDIRQQPVINSVSFTTTSENCGPVSLVRGREMLVTWSKDPSVSIVSVSYEIETITSADIEDTDIFNPPISTNSNASQIIDLGCSFAPESIRITITDSDGQTSEVFTDQF